MPVADADIGAALKKQGNDLGIAGQRGDDERRVACVIRLRNAGAAIQRLPDLVEAPASDRVVQRRGKRRTHPKEQRYGGSPEIFHKELLRPYRWYPRAENPRKHFITNASGWKE
jgi:hypothetical protein